MSASIIWYMNNLLTRSIAPVFRVPSVSTILLLPTLLQARISHVSNPALDNIPADQLQDDTYNIFIWTAIEPCVGIVCACLPALGPIFQGAHSPGSLIGSIRNYVNLRTQGSHLSKSSLWTSHPRSQPEQWRDSSSKSFHRTPEDAIILTSAYGRRPDDTEDKAIPPKGIFVHTKMCSVDNGTD